MLMKCYSNAELGEQAEAWEKGSISLLHLSNGALLGVGGGEGRYSLLTHIYFFSPCSWENLIFAVFNPSNFSPNKLLWEQK